MTPRPTDPATLDAQPARPASPPHRHPDPVTAGPVVRVLVVDGDHRVRDSLADLIGLAEEVEVVGTTSQPAETLEAIDRLDPAVIVIDPYLPDLAAGLAVITLLRVSHPTLRIVATLRDDGLDAVALAAGADACVDRCADPAAFQEAVLAAVCPVAVASGADAEDAPARPSRPSRPRPARQSTRATDLRPSANR